MEVRLILISHRIIELMKLENPSLSQLCLIPTYSPAQGTERCLQPFLVHLQGWGLNSSLGSP